MRFQLVESKEDRQKLIDIMGDELASDFFRLKHYIRDTEKKNLYNWLDKTPNELRQYLDKLEKKTGVIYSDDKWKVYHITSPEMLNELVGRHKMWCIQNRHSDNGLDWTFHAEKNGTDYYLYIDKQTGRQYLRGINDNDFMEDGVWGEDNKKIRNREFIKSLPPIK